MTHTYPEPDLLLWDDGINTSKLISLLQDRDIVLDNIICVIGGHSALPGANYDL